jgi:hypothetical protein
VTSAPSAPRRAAKRNKLRQISLVRLSSRILPRSSKLLGNVASVLVAHGREVGTEARSRRLRSTRTRGVRPRRSRRHARAPDARAPGEDSRAALDALDPQGTIDIE